MDKDAGQEHAHKRHLFGVINLGYVAAGLSSLATAWLSIGNHFYKNVHEEDRYTELKEDLKTALADAYDIKNNFWKSMWARRKAHKDYITGINKKLVADLGIENSIGVTNSFQKFMNLKGHQQAQVGLTVFTVAAIGIGAFINLSKNHTLERQFKHLEAEQDEHREMIKSNNQALAKNLASRQPAASHVERLAVQNAGAEAAQRA